MRDIEEFRQNLEKIIETEKKRFKDPLNALKVLEFDEKWRTVLQELEVLRRKRNEMIALAHGQQNWISRTLIKIRELGKKVRER